LDDARKLLLHMMSLDTLLQNYGSSNSHFAARTTTAAWRLDARLGTRVHRAAELMPRTQILRPWLRATCCSWRCSTSCSSSTTAAGAKP
jgi:hypothetical protein